MMPLLDKQPLPLSPQPGWRGAAEYGGRVRGGRYGACVMPDDVEFRIDGNERFSKDDYLDNTPGISSFDDVDKFNFNDPLPCIIADEDAASGEPVPIHFEHRPPDGVNKIKPGVYHIPVPESEIANLPGYVDTSGPQWYYKEPLFDPKDIERCIWKSWPVRLWCRVRGWWGNVVKRRRCA